MGLGWQVARGDSSGLGLPLGITSWPGSYCDTENGCCFPTTGKPAANFGIHGLWPNFNNGSYPSDCDPNNPYNEAEISDLISCMQKEWPSLSCPSSNGSTFWAHEWNKHGTCSESVLDQHAYFESALNLKADIVLLQILENAGIKPNGEFYSLDTIRKAIKEESGFTPGITCNVDARGNNQLYQIYLCVDTGGSNFIECPLLPNENCGSDIEFPPFQTLIMSDRRCSLFHFV